MENNNIKEVDHDLESEIENDSFGTGGFAGMDAVVKAIQLIREKSYEKSRL